MSKHEHICQDDQNNQNELETVKMSENDQNEST